MERDDTAVGPDARTMVLAFDGSCGTCRAVSARVEAVTGERLRTMPLRDPRVERWRARVWGEDAPWTPTLLRIEGSERSGGSRGSGQDEHVRAWTGGRMVRPLAVHLGVRDSLRVVRALGALDQEASDARADRRRARTVSRRAVFQVGAGAAVGFGLLRGGVAQAATVVPGGDVRFVESRPLPFAEVVGGVAAVVDHPDVANLLSAAERAALRSAPARPSSVHDGPELVLAGGGSTAFGPDAVAPDIVALARQVEHRTAAGGNARVSVLALPGDRFAVLQEFAPAAEGVRSRAFTTRLDYAAGSLVFERHSSNGGVLTPMPDAAPPDDPGLQAFGPADRAKPRCSRPAPANDPCGGCCFNGSGAVLARECAAASIVRCVFTTAGCAGCYPACKKINIGCGLCLLSTCGPAYLACCDKQIQACDHQACMV